MHKTCKEKKKLRSIRTKAVPLVEFGHTCPTLPFSRKCTYSISTPPPILLARLQALQRCPLQVVLQVLGFFQFFSEQLTPFSLLLQVFLKLRNFQPVQIQKCQYELETFQKCTLLALLVKPAPVSLQRLYHGQPCSTATCCNTSTKPVLGGQRFLQLQRNFKNETISFGPCMLLYLLVNPCIIDYVFPLIVSFESLTARPVSVGPCK